jgi:hypothetical protein
MIRVRYRDPSELSPGLHAAAERHGRTTTVYLLSGLTAGERRSALRRLRLSARMGHCPRLPAAQLGLALIADRIRTSISQAGAVFRLHPAGSTVPVMVLSGGAIAFLLFSTVSIRVVHDSRTGPAPASGTSPAASAAAIPVTGSPRAAGLAGAGPDLGGSSLATSPSRAGRRGGPAQRHAGGSGTSGGTRASTSGTRASTSVGDSGTTLSGGANPAPVPSQGGGGTAAPAPAPSQGGGGSPPSSAPQPAASSTPSTPGLCVKVGSLGVCVGV